jgi:adenylosuccinate synthase
MSVDILLGLQWGDEGKGKIVDFLAPQYNVVARFQGGPNAGHTLVFDGQKHVLHQIPSGIFHAHISNIIGNGVVLDPIIFKKEIDGLLARNVGVFDNLIISKRTFLIVPTHRLLDAASEAQKGDAKIGSTLKGIGPAYQDKYARHALRVGDILSKNFADFYAKLLKKHKELLDGFGFDYSHLPALEEEFFAAIEFLKRFQIAEVEYTINKAITEKKAILAEGAQGALLDIDFGSYPFVTSSSTMAAGACTGLGVAPRHIGEVYGIFKAYCTRVGSGPFPTELHDEIGEQIRVAGSEFGSTTGRPRRTGWLDLPALKYACMINGATQLLMMKADVLNDFDEIKICTHYELPDGEITDELPMDLSPESVQPVYTTLPGWKTDICGIKEFKALPQTLKQYITFIEEQVNVPITLISVGPDRVQTIIKHPELLSL